MTTPEQHAEVCIYILSIIHMVDYYSPGRDDEDRPDDDEEGIFAEAASMGLPRYDSCFFARTLGYACVDEPKCPGFWICWAWNTDNAWEKGRRTILARSFRYHAGRAK